MGLSDNVVAHTSGRMSVCGDTRMVKDYAPKPDWFERHSGLGGWVGAIGAVIAIFAAWWLARAEYQRAQRLEDARVNTEISLIDRTALDFDPIVRRYIALWREGKSVSDYTSNQQNDGRWLRMADFNIVPITQWPSVESYDAFKRYFFASRDLMKPRNYVVADEQGAAAMQHDTEERIEAYDGTLKHLQETLKAARR
jgi:hypothetical protein